MVFRHAKRLEPSGHVTHAMIFSKNRTTVSLDKALPTVFPHRHLCTCKHAAQRSAHTLWPTWSIFNMRALLCHFDTPFHPAFR